MTVLLTKRWTPLRYHAVQWALRAARARFKVVAAGRRSGKTEHAKREGVELAFAATLPDYRAVFAAPTRDQARELYWEDLKRLVPRWALARAPLEAKLELRLVNGARIQVHGLDKPARIEGSPLDWIACDEFADCKPTVWDSHILPALYTEGRPPGRAWLLGVPEGRDHFFRLFELALAEVAARGAASEYEAFTWPSSDILSAAEIAERKRTTDPRTFAQEYEASFAAFSGGAYYRFERAVHAAERVAYLPGVPLVLSFDFNYEPGSALALQEQPYHANEPTWRPEVLRSITAVLSEVHIPRASNTPAVCRRVVADYGPEGAIARHVGDVYVYGDPTGGNHGSAKTAGTDWDQVFQILARVPGWNVHNRVKPRVGPEKPRINAVNMRLRNTADEVGMLVDPVRCPQTILDLEGVSLLEGGTGELDKSDKLRTHWTDELGYFCERAHPIFEERPQSESLPF